MGQVGTVGSDRAEKQKDRRDSDPGGLVFDGRRVLDGESGELVGVQVA